MKEIICPHCNKAFKVDEAGYADILKQVRDSEFDEQLHQRLELAEKEKFNAVELAKEKAAGEMQKAAAVKDTEIQELKARLDKGEESRKLAVAEAMAAVEKERDKLANELAQARQDTQNASQMAVIDSSIVAGASCSRFIFKQGAGSSRYFRPNIHFKRSPSKPSPRSNTFTKSRALKN